MDDGVVFMEGRKVFALVVLGTASIFILMAFFVVMKSGFISSTSQKMTGLIIASPEGVRESESQGRDLIEINNDDLVKCCSFVNEIGIENSCFVMKRYDCSYCTDACNKNN